MGYRDYETTPVPDGLAPPWLLGPKGAAWLGAFGDVKDSVVDLVKQAVQARLPAYAPADALGPLGDSRGLVRGVVEPEANFRSRLAAAMQLWLWAGTPYGVLSTLYAAGYTSAQLQTQTGQQFALSGYTGDPVVDLSSTAMTAPVHLGGTPAELWSDFAVLIPTPWPSWWNGVAPADGSDDQKTVAAIVARWKPGHCRCVKLAVVSGPTWDGAYTWDQGGVNWDSGTQTAWTPPVG